MLLILDCCAPLDFSSVVMTTCNYYNYTELHCPHGTYLHGSINNNNNDIYCSGLLTDEELLVFYCEGIVAPSLIFLSCCVLVYRM